MTATKSVESDVQFPTIPAIRAQPRGGTINPEIEDEKVTKVGRVIKDSWAFGVVDAGVTALA